MKGLTRKPSEFDMKIFISKLLSTLLAFVLMLSALSGCGIITGKKITQDLEEAQIVEGEESGPTDSDPRTLKDVGNKLFSFICSDYIFYHQFVSDPDNFDFDESFVKPAPHFYDVTLEAAEKEFAFYRTLLDELDDFDFSTLSKDDQRLYCYLSNYLNSSLALEPYFYLKDPYGPSIGAQIDLPLTLMTYSFRTKQDIDDYLFLVADVPRILDQANDITRERISQGLFPNLYAVETAIEEASVYTLKTSNNLLITTFEDALNSDAFPFNSLANEEREAYKSANQKIVENAVAPAFQDAIALLKEVSAMTSYKVTLASQPGAEEYYAAWMRIYGFSQSPEQAIITLDEAIDSLFESFMSNAGRFNPYEWDDIAAANIPSDAAGIIEYFNSRVGEDFPDIGTQPFTVDIASDNEVIKAFTAFYVKAPVDNLKENLIKYYPQNMDDLFDLGTTLAHESFPGHLYQYNYFGLSNPQPIELLLGSIAYQEGFAVYSEYYGLRYMGFSENMAEMIHSYEILMRALQVRIDFGINYEGWNLSDTRGYLSNWNMAASTEEVFRTVAASPLISVPYGLGPLVFHEMLTAAQSTLGDAFDLIEFHAEILKNGAVPMAFLEKEFTLWLYENKAGGSH